MHLNRFLAATVALLTWVAALGAASDAIFDEKADAHQQIAAALAEASKAHKNVVLDFGANWCGDCHALEAQMQKPELAALIAKSYVVVNVDVGKFDKNTDLAKVYGIPLNKGIPALAVLDSQDGVHLAVVEDRELLHETRDEAALDVHRRRDIAIGVDRRRDDQLYADVDVLCLKLS